MKKRYLCDPDKALMCEIKAVCGVHCRSTFKRVWAKRDKRGKPICLFPDKPTLVMKVLFFINLAVSILSVCVAITGLILTLLTRLH